jgi:hypothetical protein
MSEVEKYNDMLSGFGGSLCVVLDLARVIDAPPPGKLSVTHQLSSFRR